MPAIDLFNEAEITAYPFVASAERAAWVRENFQRVVPGMSAQGVRDVLGAPDEVRSLFEPKVKSPKLAGHTYWYVLQRLAPTGSEADQQESLVRVSFDLLGRVTDVYATGLAQPAKP